MRQLQYFLIWIVCTYCLTLFIGFPATLYSQDTAYVVLASGSYGSPYHEVANDISHCLNRQFKNSKVVPISTEGSLDNLNRLKERSVDLIIAQRDVLVSGYYQDQQSIKNFEVILPLFPEGLQIFINGSKSIYTIADLSRMIKAGKISSFAIGPKNATTHQTTKHLLDLNGINIHDSLFDVRSPNEYIPAFIEGKVDAMAFLAASPIPAFLNKNIDSIGVISLSDAEIDLVLSHERNLDEIRFHGNDYPFLEDSLKYNTIGTWAFLAALTSLNDNIEYLEKQSIGNILFKELTKRSLSNNHLSATYHGNDRTDSISQLNPYFLNNGFNENKFFRGLPLSADLEKNLGINDGYKIPYFLIFLIIAVFGALSIIRLRIDPNKYWIRYGHVLIGTAFLVVSYFILSEVIIWQEREFYRLYGVKSPILDLTKRDLHKWLLISILTNYNADIFPISLGAQVSTTASFFLLWTTGVFMLGYELLFRYIQKQRKKGMKNVKSKGHIVICGWNERAVLLISNLLRAEKGFLFKKSKKIVLVNTVVRDLLDSNSELKVLHDSKKIELIHRSPSQHEALAESNVLNASTVVLLSDNSSREADERTLLRALAISSYCRKEHRTSQDRIYMIAEINNPEFKSSLYTADVNEIVCHSEIQNGVIIQNILNHGLSDAMHELTTYNDYNEFYTIDLRDHQSLVGKTFDELLGILRNKKILLLGIKSVHYDEEGNEVIDKNYKAELDKKEFGIHRQLMINPFTKEEEQYVTDNDDQLIVLARNEKVIHNIQ